MIAMLDITPQVSHTTLAFFGMQGSMEWIVVLIIGLLLFGRRLPEVGRGVGKSIVEFRKGIQGIEDEIDDASRKPAGSTEKTQEHLPSAQSRSEMIQPDPRAMSQDAVSPPRPSSDEIQSSGG